MTDNSLHRPTRWLAVCFAIIAFGIHQMAVAVDRNDPRVARTVFVALMGLGACVGWLARELLERYRRRRDRGVVTIDLDALDPFTRRISLLCNAAIDVVLVVWALMMLGYL